MQRNLFVVMRLGSAVVLSYLDAGFEPRCGLKDFLSTCWCLLQWSPNAAGKRLIFTSKWTTAWHHGAVHALLNTHLPSFDSPIAMKE